MKRLLSSLFVVSLAVLFTPGPAGAAGRFPHPDFESGYRLPEVSFPEAGALWRDGRDMALLGAALVVAAWLALVRRSRAGLLGLTAFSLAYFGFWRKGCVCPVGAIQNVADSLFDPSFGIPLAVLVFFLLPLVFALLAGRVFCAGVCPLGAIQDLVVWKPVRIPAWLERALGLTAYVYLGAALLFVFAGSGYLVCRFDPFVSFFRMSGPLWTFVPGAALLLIGLFVGRPYCRFLCPYGVVLGWFSSVSARHVAITPDECVRCTLCEDACPFGAIRKPTCERPAEPLSAAARRLGGLLLLLPVLMAGGAWAGRALEPALARSHPDVRLFEALQHSPDERPGTETLEVEVFRSGWSAPAELAGRAEKVRRRFRSGGLVFGAFMGLAVGGHLLAHGIRFRRQDYEADRRTCLSCGRCFAYCPRERARRAGRRTANAERENGD